MVIISLWFKYKKSLAHCPKCEHEWYRDINENTLKKVIRNIFVLKKLQ